MGLPCTHQLLLIVALLFSCNSAFAAQSNIIPGAGAADLYGDNGDVSTTGDCAADIKSFCKDVGKGGEGRIAACLTQRMRALTQGNAVGRKVGDKCVEELTKFKMDRSSNINKDVPLARACKEDAVKLCEGKSDAQSPGIVVHCLRDKVSKLSSSCKAEVFRVEQEVADDYRFDHRLYQGCKTDVKNLCEDVEQGDEIDCLESKRASVSWECQAQMNKFQKDTGADMRLNKQLLQKCYGDYRKFCKDVEPGNMAAQECLEDKSDDPGFSEECKETLSSLIAKRVANFEMDVALREACEDEFKSVCGQSLEEMDKDERVQRNCVNTLQDHRDDLKSDKCKAEVHRRISRQGKDIRFDDVLAVKCSEDRAKFCADVQPGSARVIRCLQDHQQSLAQSCAAALFDHEVRMAEDIDFKYPMKKACSWEISNFCKNVPHGHARIIRCLEQQLDHTDMSKECRDETTRNMNRMAGDYRLNWRLNHACEADINNLCRNVCQSATGCGGLVLQCLQEKEENVTSDACKSEVFYYKLMEVSDFRNDIILAEACRSNVEEFCKDVEPGEGRVHTCLRFHKNQLSEACAREENKLQRMEANDIRLRPRLAKLCSEERAVYCKDVKPGKARVIKCLIEHMSHPNFGEDCKNELQEREELMKSDYRYDVGVLSACAGDVEEYCADAKTKLRGNATVLKCLVDNFRSVTDGCQTEMSRAVRLALWDYKPGAALTASCDKDVDTQCPRGSRSKSGAVFTIGVIGRCLSKSLVEGKSLEPKCRELVLVAAPKDIRSYFATPESANMLVSKIAQLQSATGMGSVLVDTQSAAGSSVTVTGWVALACIISLIVVVIGGAFMLYKRFTGQDKPHTLIVKDGAA